MITRYIAIAALVLIALLSGALFMLKKENGKLHEAEGTYKAQIKELASTIAIKDKDIALCNSRTEALKAESDKRSAYAEKARAEARKAGEMNRVLADKLLAFKRKEGENSCTASERLFNEYLDQRAN
jgi:hypothetical protein